MADRCGACSRSRRSTSSSSAVASALAAPIATSCDYAGLRASKVALLLVGPTGTGKSRLAHALAKEHAGEIVSVDSCAVYRGMDIGTAKPSAAQRREIAHHLIDIRAPDESYSVGDFFRDAQRAVAAIQRRGKLAILAGGSMMYVNSLLGGLIAKPAVAAAARARARQLVAKLGAAAAHSRLKQLDPSSAARLSANDRQRIVRCFELHFATNRPPSELDTSPAKPTFAHVQRYLVPADPSSHRRGLAARFDAMLSAGLVCEVSGLIERYGEGIDALRTVGYRQIAAHVTGRISLDEARARGIVATRQLAKRQMSWIRRFQPAADRIVAV